MIVLTRELVELKYKILNQKINDISDILNVFSVCMNCNNEIKSISIIQEQYQRMYNEIIRTGEYQKYPEIEDIIISKLAKIEFRLDQKVYDTAKTHESVLDEIIKSITESTNCKEFHGLDEELAKIEGIKGLVKLYSAYINKQAKSNAKEKITSCKVNLLLRRELEKSLREDDKQRNPNFKELLEEIVSELQKIYDSSKTVELEQKIYNIDISNSSQIEKLLQEIITENDKKQESTKTYELLLDGLFERIRNSVNYKEAHGVDRELEKIDLLKELLQEYAQYVDDEERGKVRKLISTFKFELLLRRQLEQMVYENGGIDSQFLRYDNEEERKTFEEFFDKLMNKIVMEDSTLKSLYFSYLARIAENEHRTETVKLDGEESFSSKIMGDNILINHIVYKVLEKEIEKDPNQFIGLLQAPIFNPHMCNIANDPYPSYIPYTEKRMGNEGFRIFCKENENYLNRKKVNLSLLKSVMDIISDNNTTIMECDNIFKRFGFECRPITINEGQELVRLVFDKVRYSVGQKPKPIDTSRTKGQWCKLEFIGLNYDFAPNTAPFLTTAKVRKELNISNRQIQMLLLMGKKHLSLEEQKEILKKRDDITYKGQYNIEKYNWECPLSNKECAWTPLPIDHIYTGSRHTRGKFEAFFHDRADIMPLWNSYKKDFEELGVRVNKLKEKRYYSERKMPCFTIFINLDDIASLPIDFEKVQILTEEDRKILEEPEDEQSFRE